MKASNLVGSVLQRFNTPLTGNNQVGRPASPSHGRRPPAELSLRASTANMPPRAHALPPALSTAGLTVTTQPPLRRETADAGPQHLHADVLKAADQVGWLSSLQKDVEDQTARVLNRLTQAQRELADKQRAAGPRQQSEIRPVEPAATAASTPAELRQIQEQVDMLSWRHRTLGERQQKVAQMLQEARNDLAQAQGAMVPPHTQDPPARPVAPEATHATSPAVPLPSSPVATPFATPLTTPTATPLATPWASAHGSPPASRPASPQTQSASAASAAPATAPQPQRLARLARQARELEQAVRQLEGHLNGLKDRAQATAIELDHAKSQFETAEAGIPQAILEKDAGTRARLDTESAKAYAVMTALEQREAALDRSRETLTARLDSVQRDLAATHRQLAAAGGSVGETSVANPRPPALSTATSARPDSDADLLSAALPHGGAALARLADRAARASPRTLKDRLRATFQGRPKPMEGPRQDAFVRLVHTDVMAVARQGMLHLGAAIDLMRTAVTRGELGPSLSQNDRDELLAALNVVEVDHAHQG